MVTTTTPRKRSFVPTLISCVNSAPIPEKYLEGYFPNLEPRISHVDDKETSAVSAMEQEWLDRGGCAHRPTSISAAGSLLALTFPEGNPEKIVQIAALTAVAFIIDDHADGDLIPVKDGYTTDLKDSEREELNKNYGIVLDQMKAKYYVEALRTDAGFIDYIEGYENWHRAGLETENFDGVVFETFEEYANARFDTTGAEEWATHAALRKPDVPQSAIFLIMRLQDVSVAEAKDIVMERWFEMEKQYLRMRERLVEESGSAPVIVRYVSQLHYLIAGTALTVTGADIDEWEAEWGKEHQPQRERSK
ncbi:hypothetical protein ABW19_dt0203237 [Dactylella cylindrospora]|nr:hypothetical protein ABW19_dt0203237 [Dactylella cylindrospora]